LLEIEAVLHLGVTHFWLWTGGALHYRWSKMGASSQLLLI
jgi:hypothetical protein